MKPPNPPTPLPTSLPIARRLRPGQHVRVAAAAPLCLRAEHGTLWVTVDGRAADIVLGLGATRRFESDAVLTVGTLGGDAVLTAVPLNEARRPGPAAAVQPAAQP